MEQEELKHSFGRKECLPATPDTVFLSIPVRNLRALVEKQRYESESACARRWLACRVRYQFLEEQKRLEKQRKAEEKRIEQERKVEEAHLREQAAIRATAFLSFKYGGTIEERTNVGRWSAHQLVSSQSDSPQTHILTPSVPRFEGTNVLKPSTAPSFNLNTPKSISRSNGGLDPAYSAFNGLVHPVAVPIECPLSPTDSDSSNGYALRKLSVQTPNSEPPTPTDSGIMSSQPTRDITGGVDASIKDLIQQLFFLQQHISQFRNDKQAGLINQAEEVARSIGRLEAQASRPDNPLQNLTIAPEIIDYVEDGRNPDIYTRDFVELVQRGNSVMNGKQKAFRDFSKIYAKALKDNFDGLDEEVDMIMAESGLVEKNGKYVEKGLQNGNSS